MIGKYLLKQNRFWVSIFPMHYNVAEKFISLQSEGGPGLGKLAYFIRFQICNLRCDFCDTKYTWTESSDPNWKVISHKDLLESIQDQPSKRIIFTGGEPLLTNFSPLIADLDETYAFEVETNGTIIPHEHHGKSWIKKTELRVQWNVSPKYPSNSKQPFDAKALRWWASQQEKLKILFKFVVRHKTREEFSNQLREVKQIAKKFKLKTENIFVMLEGATRLSQTEHLKDYVGKIVAAGLNWSPRLHVLAWGDHRGV